MTQVIPTPPEEQALIDEYTAWLNERGIEPMCAHDALWRDETTDADAKWLINYIDRWNDMMEKTEL